MDSLAIAQALDTLHPSPSLHLDTAHHTEAQTAIFAVFLPLIPVFLSFVRTNVVVEEDIALIESRAAQFRVNTDLTDPAVREVNEQSWEKAKPAFEKVQRVLSEHKTDNGPFVLGSRVSHADFVLVAVAKAFRALDEGVGERFLDGSKALRECYAACEPWLRKDT